MPLAAQAALYLPGETLDPACAPTDSNCGISTVVASSTANSIPYYATNGSILSATSSLTILSNGNVGIGTTSPYAKLSVVGEAVAQMFTATSTTATSTFAGGLSVAGTNGITTLANGNTEMGTPSSSGQTFGVPLTIEIGSNGGSGNYPATSGTTQNGGLRIGVSGGSRVMDFGVDGGTGAAWIQASVRTNLASNKSLLFNPNGGNVGIGMTSPYANLSVATPNGASGSQRTLFAIASSTASATTTLFSVANTGDVTINGSSGSTCTLGNGTGATSCTSDERLKTNITLIVDPLKSIEQIKGVTFNWADPTKNQSQFIGVVAQDVQKVFPQAVSTIDGYLAVDYAALVAPLIEAVKELAGQVSSLAATVAGFAQKFTTNELCVGSTCVTESQLKAMLQNNGQTANPPPASDSTPSPQAGGGAITIIDVPPSDTSATTTQTETTTTPSVSDTVVSADSSATTTSSD